MVMKNFAVDMSQLFYMNVFARINDAEWEPSADSVRPMLEGSLKVIERKMGNGMFYHCYDATRSWRKDYYPHYKENRKKSEDINWDVLFEGFNEFRTSPDLPHHKSFLVDGAEGDDLIAFLASTHKSLTIVSGDKDFKQLLTRDIRQFDPRTKKWFDVPDEGFILEHIIKGDSSDNIPNIYTDVITKGTRQQSVTKKFLSSLSGIPIKSVAKHLEEGLRGNFERNRKLIDLTYINEDVWSNMESAYNSISPKNGISGLFAQRRMESGKSEQQENSENTISNLF